MQEFELFTDAARIKAVFQQRLPEFSQGKLLINDCQILQSWYKTYLKEQSRGKSFFCAYYRLEVTDLVRSRRGVQLLYTKACLEGRSRLEFEQAKTIPLASPGYGQALVHLPELDMLVWAFPNDPHLPHLPEVIDPHRLTYHLPYQRLPAGFRTVQDVAGVEPEVVHYYPEQRCTTRYRLQGQSSDLTIFGKTFKVDSEGREIFRRIERLWHRSLAEPDSFLVAQPLAYNERVKTIWQASQPGTPLVKLLDESNYHSLLEAMAKGLVSLHQSGLSSPIRHTLDSHMAEIHKKSAKLIRAFPALGESLPALLQELAESMLHLTWTPQRLIHGDFHIRQLLVYESKIVFFDFDEFALGDPMQDLANFIVDLYGHGFEPGLVKRMAVALYEAYQAQAPWPAPFDRLRWHLRLQFITKAYRAYRQQKPGVEQDIQDFINLAQAASVLEPVT